MAAMRAKMKVANITTHDVGGVINNQVVVFSAVCKKGGYDSTGEDENNTFAKWTPAADARFTITNPALFNTFQVEEEYYVDFTKAD